MNPSYRFAEENYYAVLNLSDKATSDEINNAYRQWSLIYHPDKHIDPKRKKWAEIHFNKIKTAHEVLIDEHKRRIYDVLGKRGLQMTSWHIVPWTKTQQEIIAEYERFVEEKKKRSFLNSNSKTTTVVTINATDIFNPYNITQGMSYFYPRINISNVNMSCYIESLVSPSCIVALSSNVVTKNGTGSGLFGASLKQIFRNGWVEFKTTVGDEPMTTIQIFRSLTSRINTTGAVGLQFSSYGLKYNIISGLITRLGKKTEGHLIYRMGSESSMTAAINHYFETSSWNITVQLGLPRSFSSICYTKELPDREIKFTTVLKVGNFGVQIECGAQAQITQKVSVSSIISLCHPLGVIFKIKLFWGQNAFSFPIYLCDEPLIVPWFYSILFSTFSWFVLKKLIDQVKMSISRQELINNKAEDESKLLEIKTEAKQAIELMKETYIRIKAEEEKRNGLVIISALYGKLPIDQSHHNVEATKQRVTSTDQVMDVTVPVQCLVKNSVLNLYNYSKCKLPGFYDLCVKEEKHLTIKYSHRGVLFVHTFRDELPIRLPLV